MKKQKQCVSKEETRIISSTTSTKVSGENSGQIPTDIILDILSRVPAKSIARFRCMSKDWSVTLRRPYFTDLFLKMSSLRPCLLFTFHAEGKWSFFSSPESLLISDQKSSRVAVDYLSHVPIDYPIRACVPVCGLSCTKDEWVLSGKKDARMMLCNPSTGGFTVLPKVKTRRRRILTYLGYDPVEKVYKVLCMTSCEKPFSQKAEQHQVLTFGTGKMNWRMIECSVPHCPRSIDNEICINGVLYYLADGSGSLETSMPMIVCFDIRSEKFKFIVDEAFKDIEHLSTLINYKGKLGILHPNASVFSDERATGFVLWVIDDIENHTWSKNIIMLPSLWWGLVAGTRFHIVGTTGDSEIMFSPSVVSIPFYIFCYNMETNSIRRVEIQGLGPVNGQKIYTYLNHVENVKLLT
ncbi:F-box protein [Raphanus sativus]|nr:F-box protein [Raphanus sativus]